MKIVRRYTQEELEDWKNSYLLYENGRVIRSRRKCPCCGK